MRTLKGSVVIMTLVMSVHAPVNTPAAHVLSTDDTQEILSDDLYLYFVVLREQGEYPEAVKLAEKALEIAESAFGPEHFDTAIWMDRLGELHLAQGRNTDAEAVFQRSLVVRMKAKGRDPKELGELQSLSNRASLSFAHGKVDEAEALIKQVLSFQEDTFGQDHAVLTATLEGLGAVYVHQRKHAEQELVDRRLLTIWERIFGPDHLVIAATLENVEHALSLQGKFAEAESVSKRVLAIHEKALGGDHPTVASDLNALGVHYEVQGKRAEAEACYKRALVIEEKAFGPDSFEVARTLTRLGGLYYLQHRYTEAEVRYQRGLTMHEKKAKEYKRAPNYLFYLSGVGHCLDMLTRIYEETGRYAEAEQLYKRSLPIDEKVSGRDSPIVAQTLQNYATVLRALGRVDQAESLELRAKRIRAQSSSKR